MKCEKCDGNNSGEYGSGRFCSVKCARGFSTKLKRKEINSKITIAWKNKPRKEKPIKYRKCPVYGINIVDVDEYKTLKWNILANGRIKTINRLSRIFDIQLGVTNTHILLDNGVETLEHDYNVLELSGADIKKKYNFKCHESNVLNFLKSLGINRRTLSDSLRCNIKR